MVNPFNLTFLFILLGRLGRAAALIFAISLFIGMTAIARAQTKVSIELVLAADTSISVDSSEYRLQMLGIANALRDPAVVEQIEALPNGAAIALIHWSVAHLNYVAVDWHHLYERSAIMAFADLVENARREPFGRSTAVGDAIEFSRRQIERNAFQGDAMRIDISGDERSNSGPDPTEARDRAVAAGMTVNGLAITGSSRSLYDYYRSRVIGGHSAFVISVDGFEDFQTAMQLKLIRELSLSASLDAPAEPETVTMQR